MTTQAKELQYQIEQLSKANLRLREAVESDLGRISIDASIKRFEFTYELAWKLMKKALDFQGISCSAPRRCIRSAAEHGLINNPSNWIGYLDLRNLTVHTYNQETADEVYADLHNFIEDVSDLIEECETLLEESPQSTEEFPED